MQAIILAAGKGNRLGKHTKDNTKCMVAVNGDKLIDRAISALSNAGVRKIVIVVGYKSENLKNYLSGRYAEMEVLYIENPVYDITNNIYSLYLAKDYLLDDDTILLESDLIFDPEIINKLITDKRQNLAVVDKYQAWMDGTVVKLDNNDVITSFIPKKSFSFGEIHEYYKTVNIYKFSKLFSATSYVPFLDAYSTALGRNEYYEQVLRVIAALENNDLSGMCLEGEKWYEIDDIQDLDIAETIFSVTPENKLKKIQQRYGGYWRFSDIKDFCYLVNPYFPTSRLENELKFSFHTLVSQYPSGLNTQNLLAAKLFGIDQEIITVGNGATELITALSSVLPGKFGMMTPCFAEYPNRIGTERMVLQTTENTNYAYDATMLESLAQKCDNLIIVNPDNPSGHFLTKVTILELASKLRNKTIILDESFVDFSDAGELNSLLNQETLSQFPNLIIIKSISKSYGVPGLRLGVLATTNTSLLQSIKNKLSIWNINSFGEMFLQIIGKHKTDYAKACETIAEERDTLYANLCKIEQLKVYPSQANYFLCRILSSTSSTQLAEHLLDQHSIFIKDLSQKSGFSNGSYVRLAVRNSEDNDHLISALTDILSNGK
jgi:histidinol-phosphate/aromatic aminotransferase/cobyric acid decarboxylase-like protein/choline kinase